MKWAENDANRKEAGESYVARKGKGKQK